MAERQAEAGPPCSDIAETGRYIAPVLCWDLLIDTC